jgi:hypothetical protein
MLQDDCPAVVVLEALSALGWRPSRPKKPHLAPGQEPDDLLLKFYHPKGGRAYALGLLFGCLVCGCLGLAGCR